MSAVQDFQHQFFDMLMQSQYWPEDVMVAYQRSQLEQLLRHARATVPFYESRLDPVFKPDGSIDWDRWREIPILKRSDLGTHHEALLSRTPLSGHGWIDERSTSGSTGDPVTFRVTELWQLMAVACRWRGERWQEVDWSKSFLIGRSDHPKWRNGQRMGPWGPPWLADAQQGVGFHLSHATTINGILRLIEELRPAYLAHGPKAIQALGDVTLRDGLDIQLDGVIAYGSKVDEIDREVARNAFGARLLEIYSSKEAGAIAHPCPDGPDLHVHAEALLIEVVNDDGTPTPEGEEGRVIVTPFASSAQPLIRYDQGDRVIAGGRCKCGRCLPTIRAIQGRAIAIFRHPDGRLSARMLPMELRSLIGAGLWQVAQVGPTNFEVRYVLKDSGTVRDEAEFLRRFRQVYFEDASVELIEVPSAPMTAGGKFVEYVNAWNPKG